MKNSNLLLLGIWSCVAQPAAEQVDQLLANPDKLNALLERVESCNEQIGQGAGKKLTKASFEAFLASHYAHHLLSRPVTCSYTNASLTEVLAGLATQAEISLVVDSEVSGFVGVCVARQEPIGQLVKNLLSGRTPPVGVLVDGQTVRVATQATLCAYLAQQRSVPTPLVHTIIPLRHRLVSEQQFLRFERLWQHCCQRFPDGGKSSFFGDESQRALVVQGSQRQVDLFASLVAALDQPSHQVHLQARIIIASDAFLRGLGASVQGIFDARAGGGISFAGLGELAGSALPTLARTATSATLGASSLALPIVFGGTDLLTRRFNLLLNAAEENRQVRTLLQPSLLVEDGHQAELLDGQVVPIESMIEEAVEGRVRNVRSAQYKDVGMQLKVRPTVLDAGRRVQLELSIENSQVISQKGPYPTISSTRAKSKVLLSDGQTVLFGGLASRKYEKEQQAVPWFARLPIIGRLFQGASRQRVRSQLALCVTARIAPIRY